MSTNKSLKNGGISNNQLKHINSDAFASLDNIIKIHLNTDCMNKVIIKEDTVWSVPENVGYIKVTACAAGGDGGNGYGKAGEFVLDLPVNLRGKREISITVGKGNTIFDEFFTLIANSSEESKECNKLGYLTGYGGGGNSPGGILGFGGGHGDMDPSLGNDGLADFGGKSSRSGNKNATKGTLIYKGAYGTSTSYGVILGGDGSEYGSGAGGLGFYSNMSSVRSVVACGGGAGGYGAGGGKSSNSSIRITQVAEGSQGCVIIEW